MIFTLCCWRQDKENVDGSWRVVKGFELYPYPFDVTLLEVPSGWWWEP